MSEKNHAPVYERYPRTTLALIILVGVIGVIACAEIFARHFLPQWAPVTSERARFWQFDKLLGWSQIPGQKAGFNHPDFSTWVEINSLGLRDREYTVKRNARKRMLVLGDSYGWGFGVNNEAIFTELMEARHPDWEIINASVSGYGTVQQYLYLKERGLLLEPDLVLVLFNDNDFQDSIGLTEYWYNKPVVSLRDNHYEIVGLPVPPQSLHQKLDVFFLGNFFIVRGLYAYLQAPVSLVAGLLSPSTTKTLKNMDSLEATGYVLGEMIALNKTHQVQTVIVQTPLSDTKHAAIHAQCVKYAIPCLHLKSVFKADKNVMWHFEHDRHWNETGHQMAAEAVDNFLQKGQLWDNPKP